MKPSAIGSFCLIPRRPHGPQANGNRCLCSLNISENEVELGGVKFSIHVPECYRYDAYCTGAVKSWIDAVERQLQIELIHKRYIYDDWEELTKAINHFSWLLPELEREFDKFRPWLSGQVPVFYSDSWTAYHSKADVEAFTQQKLEELRQFGNAELFKSREALRIKRSQAREARIERQRRLSDNLK